MLVIDENYKLSLVRSGLVFFSLDDFEYPLEKSNVTFLFKLYFSIKKRMVATFEPKNTSHQI